MIAVDRDLVKMNTAVGADDQIAPRIDLRDNTGDTDRIEAVLFQILPAVIGAQHHQDDFFSFKRRAPGHFLVCVNREKDVRIGNDNRVINGNNCHIFFLLIFRLRSNLSLNNAGLYVCSKINLSGKFCLFEKN